jgi:predicted metal-dependent enzyme (double-stranded beta helix superfamily)
MTATDGLLAECVLAASEHSPTAALAEWLRRNLGVFAEGVAAPPDRSELVVLHHSDRLTVLAGWWAPGLALGPHDHQLWLVAGVFAGREDNALYRRTRSGVVASGTRSIETNQVLSLGAQAIHAVHNPTDSWTGVVQIYGGDLFATARSQFDAVTLEERPFDYGDAAAQLARRR